jgi:hypothetical protein
MAASNICVTSYGCCHSWDDVIVVIGCVHCVEDMGDKLGWIISVGNTA